MRRFCLQFVYLFLILGLAGCFLDLEDPPPPDNNEVNVYVSFSSSTQTVLENAQTVQVSLSISPASSEEIIIPYTVAGTATYGADHNLDSGNITIDANSTSASITFNVIADGTDELGETIIINLGTPSDIELGDITQHTVTIQGNVSNIVTFSSASQTVNENVGTVELAVTLAAAPETETTVPFTVSGTATYNSDHNLQNGNVIFSAGSTSGTLSFSVLEDAKSENDETIIVTLSPSGFFTGTHAIHTLTISGETPVLRHIILLIGDGMGPEQVKAGGHYVNGAEGTLFMETLPYQAQVTTAAANNAITDSAAAATAIATGFKTNTGVISLDPNDASELETALEYHKNQNKSTGLVTTTYITHATPAAFGAHESSRNDYAFIAADYFNTSRPNVLFGGAENVAPVDATNAGYTVVEDLASLLALNADTETYVSGQFGEDHLPYEEDGLGLLPHLSQMATVALDILDKDPDGFFLMIEGGKIDKAGHISDIEKNIRETAEFDNTVEIVYNWAEGRNDTLIIVTADHETGGLFVVSGNGAGNAPNVNWTGGGSHTAANVPIYAWGYGADQITGTMENIDLFDILTDTGQ